MVDRYKSLRDFRYALTRSICAPHSICAAAHEGFISYRIPVRGYIEWAQAHISIKKGAVFTANQKDALREESITFAINVSDICENIKGCSIFINQLLRCSSSIGANIHEAKYAQSRADFINKMEIALKESSETDYWLELLYRKKKLSPELYHSLKNQCGSIRRRLIASVTTAKAGNCRKETQ